MSLTRRVAYNTMIQIIGKVITTLISLFLVAALTRYLGVSGYGELTTVFAFTQFFAVLADFGFFWFLVREIAQNETKSDYITNNVLTFRSLVALGIFSLSFLIGFFIPQYHEIRIGIGIIAAASFWMTLNGTYVGIFQNRLRMDKAAISDIIGRLVILGLILYFIKTGASLNLLLWAYFAGNLVNFITSAILGRVYLHFRPAFNFKYWKKIFWECLPISVVTILGMIYFKIDTVILSLLKTPEDVGIYGPPYKVLEILLLFPAIFMGNVFPILARYLKKQDQRSESAFQKAFDFLVITGLPIVIGVIFLAPRIIQIVAGTEFVTSSTIAPLWGHPATSSMALQILIVAVGISFLSHLVGYTVIALGKQTKLIWPNLFLVFFNLGLNLILIPKYSYIGAAAVTVLTEILVIILYWLVMRQYFKIKIYLHILWKVVLSSIILGLTLHYFNFLSLWYLVPIGIVSYLISLWLVKGFTNETLKEVFYRKSEK